MSLQLRRGRSDSPDPRRALDDVVRDFGGVVPDAVLFFCSPGYDLDLLGSLLAQTFTCPVAGCTSAGQIGSDGFQRGGIAALGFCGDSLRMHPHLISPLEDCETAAFRLADAVRATHGVAMSEHRLFGLLLVDGLSRAEERLAAALYQALDDVPLLGGSAADEQRYEGTWVYHEGRFLRDAAVFSVFDARTQFALFKVQHFVPGRVRLVITDADPDARLIREINGESAAAVYAAAIGVAPETLDAAIFARHPLMLKLGDDHYVRSIRQANPDGSLSCFCAVEVGLVVSIGAGVDPIGALRRGFASIQDRVSDPAVILGCDCILRRVEFEQAGLQQPVGDFYARQGVFGFSTYGEQINGLHVNHTFTGIAIGGVR